KQLTTSTASEQNPHFSPDGKWIAYTANHDNNNDVYLVSANGGQPKRLTWHPDSDDVNGWSPDGQKILFTSRREMRQGRSAQAWEVSVDGGYPTKVMEAVVQSASWSNDGKTLAYQPYNTAHRGASGWRNHRGGTIPPIWIMQPNGDSYEEIPHEVAGDTNPLWIGNDVYFLSDRDKTKNLYKYDRNTKSVKKITKETTWEIVSADTNGVEIIYEAGGELKILNSKDNKISTLSITLNPELPEIRTQWKDAIKNMEGAVLSPTGKRVLISARGDIFSVPVKDGSVRNLTQSSGVRERDGIWSPKGDEIAYTSDKDGEQKLVVRNEKPGSKSRIFSLGSSADYKLRMWTADGTKIIFEDNFLGLWFINSKTGKITNIDTDNRRSQRGLSVSNDSQWLAYTKARANHFGDIYLYSFKTGQSHRITDGMSDAADPAFSRDGKHLFFTASTNSGPRSVGLDMSSQERPLRVGIYAVVLDGKGKSPLLAKSDEENGSDADKKDESKDNKASPKTVVSLDNIENRIVALPVAQRAYFSLQVDHQNNLLFIEAEQPGVSIEADGAPSRKSKLVRFDFEALKAEDLLDEVNGFALSEDGKMLLTLGSGNKLKTAKIEKTITAENLNTSDVKMRVNPMEEWAQIFDEVWRDEKHYFYAENMHGADWEAIGDRYRKLLPHVATRAELNRLMVEMIAQLEIGHNRVYGGDMARQEPVPVGLLGADFSVSNGLYQIKKIYTGENWNPDLKAPLAAPGLGINEGDYIHSINGINLTGSMNIFSLLENTVGKQVMLQTSVDGNLINSKTVTVEPVRNESDLRIWNWIEDNRKAVDKATGGKVGYVYLPNTAGAGYTYFNRMFFAQSDKQAMIIDERRNGGGQAANYITDVLSRQYLAGWKDRAGMIFETPGGAVYGPKVMLIDQDAGSGGDFLPYSFKRMGIGKLIGKTTWGGLIGISANRDTIDGGRVTVPYFRFFTPENEWRVENEGVAPDIDVTLDPVLVNKGKDAQLEAGIKEVMEQLKTYKPIKLKKAPPLPKKLGL
ncbi:MAG: PDZ domain-containing protein, partial [Gammaproteobacteria bacterium]|nr:PDZ domain-containing protein [Gammaproteobacteria bacterium]